jgi:hypothetical protein
MSARNAGIEPFNDEQYAHHWFEKKLPAASTRSLIGPRGETPHDIAIGST